MAEGDALANEIWAESINYLGRGLGAVINTFQSRM